MKPKIKAVLILLLIGTFVSAQQAASEEIIDCSERELPLERLVGAGTGFSLCAEAGFSSHGADTLETFDIEIGEEEGKNLYKEIAIFVIVAAMVGYMVIELIKPGDEEEESTSNGKDIPGPFIGISVPITQ